jgi:hypothetical protein
MDMKIKSIFNLFKANIGNSNVMYTMIERRMGGREQKSVNKRQFDLKLFLLIFLQKIYLHIIYVEWSREGNFGVIFL